MASASRFFVIFNESLKRMGPVYTDPEFRERRKENNNESKKRETKPIQTKPKPNQQQTKIKPNQNIKNPWVGQKLICRSPCQVPPLLTAGEEGLPTFHFRTDMSYRNERPE
jgi:hypothetical protein